MSRYKDTGKKGGEKREREKPNIFCGAPRNRIRTIPTRSAQRGNGFTKIKEIVGRAGGAQNRLTRNGKCRSGYNRGTPNSLGKTYTG